jgi:hypothetical protein
MPARGKVGGPIGHVLGRRDDIRPIRLVNDEDAHGSNFIGTEIGLRRDRNADLHKTEWHGILSEITTAVLSSMHTAVARHDSLRIMAAHNAYLVSHIHSSAPAGGSEFGECHDRAD